MSWVSEKWYYYFCFNQEYNIENSWGARRAYFCTFCCYFFLPTAPKFLFYHFLFLWRTSFSHCFRVGKLPTNYFTSFHLKMSYCYFIPWRIVLSNKELLVESYPLQHVKKYWPSGLQGFRWEIHCHLNWYSSRSNASFLSDSIQDFFALSLVFRSLIMMLLGMDFFASLLLRIHSVSWICR